MNYFKNKNIIIVGASGYIGSSLVNSLKDFECKIIRISRNPKKLSFLKEISAEIIDLDLDFKSGQFLSEIKKVDIIFYLSSQTSTYVAEKNIIKDYEQSVVPILELLAVCDKLTSTPTFIFSSAVTVCGLVDKLPVDETTETNPITVYDIHKLLIEKYIKFYTQKGIIKSCILRLSNVYGPGVKSSSSDRGILNLMIKKALEGENLTLYGDGCFIRDYIYIDDVIDAFLRACRYIVNTNNKHYIIGSGLENDIKKAFKLIVKKNSTITGKDIKINSIPMPSNMSKIESRNFLANNTLFCNDTNWMVQTTLDCGIEKTMKNFKLDKEG